jgi:hypothetical protein
MLFKLFKLSMHCSTAPVLLLLGLAVHTFRLLLLPLL